MFAIVTPQTPKKAHRQVADTSIKRRPGCCPGLAPLQVSRQLFSSAPVPMSNPAKSLGNTWVHNVCYINATLQLLASSNVCANVCTNIQAPLAKALQHMRSRKQGNVQKVMQALLKNGVFGGEQFAFRPGDRNCAKEFMTWCITQLELNNNPALVSRTITEEICQTCQERRETSIGDGGYGDAMC